MPASWSMCCWNSPVADFWEIGAAKSRLTPFNNLQHIATHCNTLQHIATRCNSAWGSKSPRRSWTGCLIWWMPTVAKTLISRNSAWWVCYSGLQCAAVCCSVLQGAAVCCSGLQCVAVCCSVLQFSSVSFSTLFQVNGCRWQSGRWFRRIVRGECAALCYGMMQFVAVCCSMMQCIAVCCIYIHVHIHIYVFVYTHIHTDDARKHTDDARKQAT